MNVGLYSLIVFISVMYIHYHHQQVQTGKDGPSSSGFISSSANQIAREPSRRISNTSIFKHDSRMLVPEKSIASKASRPLFSKCFCSGTGYESVNRCQSNTSLYSISGNSRQCPTFYYHGKTVNYDVSLGPVPITLPDVVDHCQKHHPSVSGCSRWPGFEPESCARHRRCPTVAKNIYETEKPVFQNTA